MTLLQPSTTPIASALKVRPRIGGKFIFVGGEKLYLRGVTYGTFRPSADGHEFPDPIMVERDFALMAAHGINAVRTYTTPPRWVLDLAWRHGLRVLIGLAAEREVGYLNDFHDLSAIENRFRAQVRACTGHPAVLAYAIGNEIPAQVVRWLGPRRVEGFLARLAGVVRAEDPDALLTYVNYPSTEYLELPFVDFVCFNVFLESLERFEAYLARLQNLAGDRPLVLAEIGLDGIRNTWEEQASTLEEQVRAAFARGSAGTFVYAWTDEWHRGGEDVTDWEFGLVHRNRTPKPALAAVSRAFSEVPFPRTLDWPRVSVVVCSFNGSRTLRDCLEGVAQIEYPDFEAIVIDDGSTDATASIAAEFCVRVISTKNRGLSAARNTGWEVATGEIVAYTDDDARPDPHWLQYLVWGLRRSRHVGIGGPNIPPPGDGPIAGCVANAPGGPMQVLLSDEEAEHIPGCNMAFLKSALQAVGGFDPRFRTAGDDVDLCWRIQERGWTLGFHPGAMVWHHRRNSVRAYWRQQQGYGRAEALLECKWPERYNAAGHYRWIGRIYGAGLTRSIAFRRGRIYQGLWGSAPFQSLYAPATGLFASLPLMPEWYLVIVALAGLSSLGVLWHPLGAVFPLLLASLAMPVVQAWTSAARASFANPGRSPVVPRLRTLTATLHLLQPVARLRGRLTHGLVPWRSRGLRSPTLPFPRVFALWSEEWRAAEARLHDIEQSLIDAGAVVRRGSAFDRWDIEVRGGLLGSARLLVGVEEHGQGRQMVRARTWPCASIASVVGIVLMAGLSIAAFRDRSAIVCGILAAASAALAVRLVWESGSATATLANAVARGLKQSDSFTRR